MPAVARPSSTPADVDAAIAATSSKAAGLRPRAPARLAAAPVAPTCEQLLGGTSKLPPGPPAITATPRPAAVALRARRGGRAAARVRTSARMVSAARTNPASNPDFQSAAIQIRVEATRQRRHDRPNVKRQEVVKSALLDKEAQTQQSSEDRNVAAMGTVGQKQLAQSATSKDAKAKKFKEEFHRIVDANNPPATESDARKLANREQAVQPFEGPFSKNLADQQAVVTKPLDQRAKNEPAIEVAPPKEAKPIPRPVYPPAPGPVNPALVVPKPKPDPEVSLKEDSDRLDGAMQKNRLSDDQLANSKEPSFLKTLKAKQDAQQKIVEARNAYRRQESAILQGATAQANQSMSTELAGMSRAHTRTGGVVHGGQKGTENDTKRRQREIKKAIDDIYKWTADGVVDILKCMTTKVTEDFRNSLKTQTEAFNNNVTKALDNYYSFGKKAKHFFLGEPKVVVDKETGNTRDLTRDDWDTSTFPPRIITPWINPEVYDIFKEEKKKFTDAMEAQLDVIAADVEKGLTAASERIKVGMAKVTAYKNTLTENEKRFADELEEDVKARFQSLEGSIDDARQDLLKSLTDEYRDSVNQLEKTFNDINEEMRKSWLDRAIEFVETVGKTIFQLAELLFSILVRLKDLVWDIISHPIRFFETLVAGLKQGISDFIGDIGTHLKEAFWTWLTDATPGKTIRVSLGSGVSGLFDLVMQVLNLGPAELRAIVDNVLGPEFMQMVDKGQAFAEKAFEPIVILFTKGPVAFWDYIKDQLEDIIQSSFDRIKESVFLAFVKKGILWIAGFFVPGGGFVKIVKAIVRAFQFVAENLERIRRFFDAVFDSMEAATQGNPAGVASKIVTGLKMGIVLALGFLARQLGLNAIIDGVHKILQSLRRPIVNAIEWLLRKVKPLVDKIVRGVTRVAGGARAAVGAVVEWWRKRRDFRAGGEQHSVYITGHEGRAELIIASRPLAWDTWVRTELVHYALGAAPVAHAAALAAATALRTTMRTPFANFGSRAAKAEQVERDLNALALRLGTLLQASAVGTNLYPGSNLDPRTRTRVQLWTEILPDPLVGYAETPRDIQLRRVLARASLLSGYPQAQRPRVEAMIAFNLGRAIRAFDLPANETAHGAAHTRRRHVLDGGGEIRNQTDLALRVLLDSPAVGLDWTAGAFRTVAAAQAAIRAGIAGQITATTWPVFRDRIIATGPAGQGVIPGDVPAGTTGVIYHNPANAVVLINDLPGYLNTYTFMHTPLAAATGTRPLYPGDTRGGVAGTPLTRSEVPTGDVRIVMLTLPTAPQGWWVLTAFPRS